MSALCLPASCGRQIFLQYFNFDFEKTSPEIFPTKSSNFPIVTQSPNLIPAFIWQYFKVGFVLRFFVHHSGEEEEEAGVGGGGRGGGGEGGRDEGEEEEEEENVDTEHNFTT